MILPFQTLRFLANGGMLFAKHIARDTFENFLKSIRLNPAYRIHHAWLREAERILGEIGCLATR